MNKISEEFYYWVNARGGARELALVFKDGSYQEINLDNYNRKESYQDALDKAIGIVLKRPVMKDWVIKFPEGDKLIRHNEYYRNVEEASQALHSKVMKVVNREISDASNN